MVQFTDEQQTFLKNLSTEFRAHFSFESLDLQFLKVFKYICVRFSQNLNIALCYEVEKNIWECLEWDYYEQLLIAYPYTGAHTFVEHRDIVLTYNDQNDLVSAGFFFTLVKTK